MLIYVRTGARPEESAAVRLGVYGAIMVAMAAVALYGHLEPLAAACMVVTTVGHGWSWRHRHGPRRLVQAVAGTAIVGSTFFLLAELFVIGSGPDPFPQGTFLLLLLTITSFDVRSRANCYSSLVLAFLGVYAASSVAYDDGMAAVVVLFAAVLLAALAAATRADLAGGATHLAPPATTRRGVRGHVWSHRAAMLAGTAMAVGVGGAVSWAALPPYDGPLPVYPASADLVASPSFNGAVVNPLLSLVVTRPHDGPRSAYYGFAPELVLGRYGRLDTTVLMRVRSTGWSYWRMQTYDSYTGRSWQAASEYANELDRGPDGSVEPATYPVEDHAATESGPTIRQTYTLVRGGPNLIAVADRPLRVYFPADRLWQRLDSGDVLADQALPAGTTYSVISRLPPDAPTLLRAARGTDPTQVVAEDSALPPLSPAVRGAAATAVAGAATRYDRVMAIIAYLAHARYDLSTPPLAPGQEGVAALLASGRGYCEQFATALAVLARVEGIPSRLVTGFAPGEYDPVARVFTVRASDAHAWTEIYFPSLGWIPFDATPSFSAQPRAHPDGGWLLGALLGPRLPRPNWGSLLHGTGAAAGGGAAWLAGAAGALVRSLLGGLVLLLVVGAVAVGGVLTIPGRTGRLRRRGDEQEARRRAVVRAYLAGERSIQRQGSPRRQPHLSPRRYAQSLSRAEARARLAPLAELAMRAAYGAGEISADDVLASMALRRTLRRTPAPRRPEAGGG